MHNCASTRHWPPHIRFTVTLYPYALCRIQTNYDSTLQLLFSLGRINSSALYSSAWEAPGQRTFGRGCWAKVSGTFQNQLLIDLPLDTAQSSETGTDGKDSVAVPGLVPVLVGEVADCAKDGNVDCTACQWLFYGSWTVRLTGTEETAGNTRAENDLLGLDVDARSLALGTLGLSLALGGVEVRVGDKAAASQK